MPFNKAAFLARWEIPPAQDESHSLTGHGGTPVKGARRTEAPTLRPLVTGGVNI
jgi:hypothetical protein